MTNNTTPKQQRNYYPLLTNGILRSEWPTPAFSEWSISKKQPVFPKKLSPSTRKYNKTECRHQSAIEKRTDKRHVQSQMKYLFWHLMWFNFGLQLNIEYLEVILSSSRYLCYIYLKRINKYLLKIRNLKGQNQQPLRICDRKRATQCSIWTKEQKPHAGMRKHFKEARLWHGRITVTHEYFSRLRNVLEKLGADNLKI